MQEATQISPVFQPAINTAVSAFKSRITIVYHIGPRQGRATMNITTDLDLMSNKTEEEELINQAIEQAKAILRERLAKKMGVPIEEVCVDGYSVSPREN